MSSYCLKCKTITENINPRVSKSRFIRGKFIRRFIKKKFLLAGNKFMPGMYLNQPRFSYSGC